MTTHTTTPAPRAGRSGFTLVELLVAISIIAVLLGILLPVANGVRISARESATTTLMTSILTASQQYQTDTQRLPGFFSQEEMGQSSNITEGFTQMENAMLSLMGGVVQNPNGTNFIRVGPRNNNKVDVDIAAIGSTDGPSYLTLDGSNLFYEETDVSRPMQVGTDDHVRFPDIVDGFGNPILMWTQNSLAGPAPLVAEVNSDDDSVKALFYWASNASFLQSRSFGARKNRNNFDSSVLSTFQSRSDAELAQSIEAIVGDPGYPIDTNPPTPSRAKGPIVLHSAGRDGIFASSQNRTFRTLRYVPSTGGVNLGADEQIVERLNDIFQAGGS